jgi:nucleotide-binding universal stress UspA family protein
MFETIVWASDGSAGADRALAHVEHVAAMFGSSLRVVHIARRPSTAGVRVVCEDEDEVLAKLRRQTAALRERGIDAALHVIRGAPGPAAQPIADTARAVDADLVIVGTRGRSPVATALMGSVALGLMHVAGCPVLAIPPAPEPVRVHTQAGGHCAQIGPPVAFA